MAGVPSCFSLHFVVDLVTELGTVAGRPKALDKSGVRANASGKRVKWGTRQPIQVALSIVLEQKRALQLGEVGV